MKKVSSFFQEIGNWCKNHKTIVALLVTTLFVASQIPFLINHEIWSDEAIPWEISKQITPSNIYELNNAEPHPLLWQLILAPFSQNNFPIITLNIISLVIVSLAVFLFVRFAPFNLAVKLIFLLSNVFFYFNPVIARDYCLIPLAITFIGITYKNRHERPLIYGLALAFISQTHFLMYGLLGILILGFVIEEIKSNHKVGKTIINILKVVLPVALSVLLLLPIIFGSFENQAIMTGKAIEERISDSRLPFFPSFQEAIFGVGNAALNIVAIILIALLVIGMLAENIKITFYLMASVAFWFFVMGFIYQGYQTLEQKCSILTMFILLTTWLLALEPKSKKENIASRILSYSEIIKFLRLHIHIPAIILVSIIVTFTIPHTLKSAFVDLELPYTSSKENAEFINSLPEGTIVIEGDLAAYNQFSPATRSQITNKGVSFYSLVFDSATNYGGSLKYDNKYIDDIISNSKLEIDYVLAKIDELSGQYEHAYFLTSSSRTRCSNYEKTIPVWLEQYEYVTELDHGEYKEPGHMPTLVFKIK